MTPGARSSGSSGPAPTHVAAQRLVDRQHRGVADRPPGGPQRLGDPVRREGAGRGGEPLADLVERARRRDRAPPVTRPPGQHLAGRPGPAATAAVAHRAQPEVDRLGEPALVGHPRPATGRPVRPARRRRVEHRARGARASARPGRAEPGRPPGPPTRRPATVGRRTTSSRSHRATTSSTSGVARSRQVEHDQCRGRAGPPPAPRGRRTAGARLRRPAYQVSTPSPSRRGSASRSDAAPSRPVVWRSSSQRTPAPSSRPSTRSSPGPSGSASTTQRRSARARPPARARTRGSSRPRPRTRR